MLYYSINNVLNIFRPKLQNITITTKSVLENFHNSSKTNLVFYHISILIISIGLVITTILFVIIYKIKIIELIIKFFIPKPCDEILEKNLKNLKTILLSLDRSVCVMYEENKILANPKIKDNNTIKTYKPMINASVRNISLRKENIKENEKLEVYENKIPTFRNRLVKISIFIIIIALFGYLFITSLNILINVKNFNQLLKANDIAVNFLDRIPILIEMIIFYKSCVLFNNPKFVTIDKENLKNNIQYSNYYNITYDPSKESVTEVLGDSLFNDLYSLFQIHKLNIQQFMNDKDAENLLPLTYSFEQDMNMNTVGCISQAVQFVQNYNPGATILSSMTAVSSYGFQCRTAAKGVVMLGASEAYNMAVNNVKNLFMDYKKSGGTASDTVTYFSNLDLQRVVTLNEFPFKKVYGVLLYSIYKDLDTLYYKNRSTEFIFSIVALMFNVAYILVVIFWIIRKFKQYHTAISHAVKKLSIASKY